MDKPWSLDAAQVLAAASSDAQRGLSAAEARQRLARTGPNRLVRPREVRFWAVFWEEVREPMILLLLVVAVIYSLWGELRDTITIVVVITLLVFAEIFTEYRAKRAVAALRRLSPPTTPVLRDGVYEDVPAEALVPGDIILLQVGECVPVDARIVSSLGLAVDESSLTGESVPVPKNTNPVPPQVPLAERTDMVFAGTTVTRGAGRAVVTATGMATELGRVTGLVLEAKEPRTPLQLAMRQLSGLLVWVAVFFSVLIPVVGILQGKDVKTMILTGLSLSFATIPEELPIIITMVLGVGAIALARQHVLVKKLRAAETLGSVSVIVTDKTGTLTENRMALAALGSTVGVAPFPPGRALSSVERRLLEVAALSASVRPGPGNTCLGDPTEVALYEGARKAGLDLDALRRTLAPASEFSFDDIRKMASAVFTRGNLTVVYAHGAPESVLARANLVLGADGPRPKQAEDEEDIRAQVEDMAQQALRVIGVAYKEVPGGISLSQEMAERDLVFVGLAGLADPPRPGVAEALKVTRAAGIRTIVVSGDHPLTVQRVAAEVGLDGGRVLTGAELARLDETQFAAALKDTSLFARATPEEKLRIVQALQKMGDIVAVTGDGINDAPALKTADIGVAMGETGTEVARETASMVLTDDSFTSVAAGVRQGRKIYDNLKKGVTYYLAVKVALVLVFLVPLAAGLALPFAPIQIILLELFMDLAASATFVAEPIEPEAMRAAHHGRGARFVDRAMLTSIVLGSLSLAAAVLFNYLWLSYHGGAGVHAMTVAFATWMVGHIYLALTMRSARSPLWRLGLFSNRVMLVWAAGALAFILLVTYLPPLAGALRVEALSGRDWLMVLLAPFVAVFWAEFLKLLRRR